VDGLAILNSGIHLITSRQTPAKSIFYSLQDLTTRLPPSTIFWQCKTIPVLGVTPNHDFLPLTAEAFRMHVEEKETKKGVVVDALAPFRRRFAPFT
jgi:hypothetical protein